MSAGAAALDRPVPPRPRVRHRDRFVGFVEAGFRLHAGFVYVFLFLPILVVVVFSFNGTNRNVTEWAGFSLKWYERALSDGSVQSALKNSLLIAVINAVLATLFGTMAALGLQRVRHRVRLVFDALTYVSVIVPEIVIALATLILFSLFRDLANPILATLQSGSAEPFKIGLGYWSIIAAHVLFNTSLVLLLVRARLSGMDRTLVEASYDLFATPWRTFRQITFPQLLPAIVAGFLLAFTFSFDDVVTSYFLVGSGTAPLPVVILSMIRFRITPEINAIGMMVMLFTVTMFTIGFLAVTRLGRGARRALALPEGHD